MGQVRSTSAHHRMLWGTGDGLSGERPHESTMAAPTPAQIAIRSFMQPPLLYAPIIPPEPQDRKLTMPSAAGMGFRTCVRYWRKAITRPAAVACNSTAASAALPPG